MKLKSFDWLFIIIVLIDLIAMDTLPIVRYLSKPFIVASLIGWYVQRTQAAQKPIILTALLFALIGDVLLLFGQNPFFFKLGIGAFLIMQISYAYYFKKFYKSPDKNKLLISSGLIIFTLLFNTVFYKALGDYKVPVMVYSLAITIMAFFGINQYLHKDIFIGSIFFVISDFILAFDKFIKPLPVFSYLIMITYAIAQYLIVRGLSDMSKRKPATK